MLGCQVGHPGRRRSRRRGPPFCTSASRVNEFRRVSRSKNDKFGERDRSASGEEVYDERGSQEWPSRSLRRRSRTQLPVQHEEQARAAGYVHGLLRQRILHPLPHSPSSAAEISFWYVERVILRIRLPGCVALEYGILHRCCERHLITLG